MASHSASLQSKLQVQVHTSFAFIALHALARLGSWE